MDWWTKIRLEVLREESSKKRESAVLRYNLGDIKEDIETSRAPWLSSEGIPPLSRRSAPTSSGSLKSSKKTKFYRRNSASSPTGSMAESGRWATRGNTPR